MTQKQGSSNKVKNATGRRGILPGDKVVNRQKRKAPAARFTEGLLGRPEPEGLNARRNAIQRDYDRREATKAAEARRKAGLNQHALAAVELVASYDNLSERARSIALKVIEAFVSVTVDSGRTAAAMETAKQEFLASEDYKQLRGKAKSAAYKEMQNGLGAARQALQDSFGQKDSRQETAAA